VEIAVLKPGEGTHVLVSEGDRPVLVQGSYGLGRVVLCALDLDGPPFSTWNGQQAFWQKLQTELAPLPAGQGRRPDGSVADMRADLKRDLERFEEIPVISFGWVALFILFYIVLVGPLDYLILKKLFKRLELTWVTFPATVLVVSVTAYLAAYALKGDDLRVNKIDVIEIDLHAPRQVYGSTWFTLFSPRIQSYTVGVEPAPDWVAPAPSGAPGPVITLLEGTDRLRTGSQGLFPRPYEYAEDATGLKRVPVPVWATRTFTASWRAPVKADKLPIDFRDEVGPLRTSRTGEGLVGRITNNLPVELQGVALFYREKWYDLKNLAPGESRRVDPLFARDAQGQGRAFGEWLRDYQSLAPQSALAPSGRPINASFQMGQSAHRLVKAVLFHQAYQGARREGAGAPAGWQADDWVNGGLRTFDQTWRIRPQPEVPVPARTRYRDEVVLVARTPLLSDRAEPVSEHGASASRLWVGRLPGQGEQRPGLAGFMTQETYVRVYIPVKVSPR
jgi:hypothetical protein